MRVISWAVLIVLCAASLAGCGNASDSDKVSAAVEPAAWNLSTPRAAVDSYLAWVSFSYRMANSDIPTATATPDEGVRINSYIELNREKGRGIEQQLTSFDVRSRSTEATHAVLAASEKWDYRYFSLSTLRYTDEPLKASYETTYTLLQQDDGRWLVDGVQADPVGSVK